jgi:hypothetical protein
MRVMLLVAAIVAAMLFELPATQAYYGNGPWCAVQSRGTGASTEDCRMLSFEQCRMETIAGNRGYCIPNPYLSGAYGSERFRRTHKRRVR